MLGGTLKHVFPEAKSSNDPSPDRYLQNVAGNNTLFTTQYVYWGILFVQNLK